MIKKAVASLFFFFSTFSLSAREEMPWFGQVFEFQWRNSGFYQFFSDLSNPNKRIPYRSNNGWLETSLQLSPWENIDTEIELSFNIHTRARHPQFNGFSITGRYLYWDDVLGDPASVAIGATLIKGWHPARSDPAVFYPAQLGWEFHASIGREVPCTPTWYSRVWLFYAFGFGDVRALWNRLNLAWEKNFADHGSLRLFANSLWGMGGRNLELPFDGYGSVRFQAIDLGFRYTHVFHYIGELSGEYAYRVHTRNFPVNTHTLMVRFLLPFSL